MYYSWIYIIKNLISQKLYQFENVKLGYVYGKGIYFANCFTTSASYCRGPNNDRLILLNKAALGKIG